MAATADYLADHPFAPPDIVNPPEAPTYRYRPDINSLVDLAGIETIALSAGSRVDIIIDNKLQTYVLQAGTPTGSDLEVVPDDYDVLLNQQYWLLVAANTASFGGTLTFADIGGTISLDQFPPESVASVDSIGEDALYFFDDALGFPRLISSTETGAFLSGVLSFSDITGTIALSQFPDGSVASLESIDEDGLYFFDNDLFVPELIGKSDALIFLLPDQTGNDGFFLQTNAGVLSWAAASGGGGSGSYTINKVARVDTSGNDGTGTVGDAALPFLTVQAALTALEATSPGATMVYVDIGVCYLVETVTTSLYNITFLGSDINSNSAFTSLTITGTPAVISLAGNNVNLGDILCEAPNIVSVNLDDVYLLSITNTSSGGQIYLGNYGNTGSSQVGNVTSEAGTITLSGVDYIGIVQAGGEAIFLYNCIPVDFTAGAAVIDSAGSAVVASFSYIGSVVAATSLTLKDSRVVGSNAAGTTTYADVLLAGDDTAYDATSWNGNTRTPTKNAIRDKFETLVIGTNVQAWDADLDTWATKTPYAGTLTITTAKTFNVTNTLTLSGTDSSTLNVGAGGTLGSAAYTASSAYDVAGAAAAAQAASQPLDSDLTTIAGLTATTDNFIVSVASAWALRTPTQVKTTLGLTIGTNVQAWDADLDTLAGLTATTDNFIVSVASAWASRTPTQVKTTLGLTIGTNVQAWDADLDTIAGLTATTDNFIVSVASAWSSRTPTQVKTTLGLVIGTNVQAWDADLDTLGSLTATTDNFIVSVSSAWASRTPTQVKTTLGLVIGTNVQAWDADLDTLASLSATTDNFIVSVASAWASRTPTQVKTTLGLVIGTNVQAWDADLDTWAGVTPASGVATFLATPSSANLRTAMTDEIGTGACVFDGATLTLLLTTATCGSSLASLNIPAGTVPTTPNDGDIFADANCFYGCSDAGNAGFIPVCHIIRADSIVTQANDANAHAIFTTPTNGRLTLETGTYRFFGLLTYSSMSGTSGNIKIDLLGAGGASTGAWAWVVCGVDGGAGTGSTGGASWQVTSASGANVVTGSTNTNCGFTISGTFEVTGAGTIIPTQTLQSAAAAVLGLGSFIEFWRVGSTSMTSVGQWD